METETERFVWGLGTYGAHGAHGAHGTQVTVAVRLRSPHSTSLCGSDSSPAAQ